jgi:hypothetical protein
LAAADERQPVGDKHHHAVEALIGQRDSRAGVVSGRR